MKRIAALGLAVMSCIPILAQSASTWHWGVGVDLRGGFRDSNRDRFRLQFPFSPEMLPPGAAAGWEETVDAGGHFEASLATLDLEVGYSDFFAARAKIDTIDLYDRNPTSGDRKIDADELWFRFGRKAEGLDLPAGTSFFVQIGKQPKMERQPVLLLESYGLAHTAFNRFEDTQALLGGSVGRNLYWRAQVSNGNPLFFRDPNALAGDNGVDVLRETNPVPRLKSGFPILYDAEVEDVFFPGSADYLEHGAGIGYRWLSADLSSGFDVIAFHYDRDLADEADLHGTFYGGDLDLLDGVPPHSIETRGRNKTETGVRFYGEWRDGTLIAQYVEQEIAGLARQGYEIEAGWLFPMTAGPVTAGGVPLLTGVQPAARFSRLDNDFRGPATFPAPSVWWDWEKLDVGLVINFWEDLNLTIEHAFHDVLIAADLDVDETLVTVRYRYETR